MRLGFEGIFVISLLAAGLSLAYGSTAGALAAEAVALCVLVIAGDFR